MKKMKIIRKQKRYEYKNEEFEGVCYHCSQKGHLSKDYWVQKNDQHKKFEIAEKSIDTDEDDLVLCSLKSESKKRRQKEKSLVCGRC